MGTAAPRAAATSASEERSGARTIPIPTSPTRVGARPCWVAAGRLTRETRRTAASTVRSAMRRASPPTSRTTAAATRWEAAPWRRRRTHPRSPTPDRTPEPVPVTTSREAVSPLRTASSVLSEAADARATVVLSGHVQPEADAPGSTLALAEGLGRRGARALATFPDPFTLPASLGWLPGAEGLVPSSAVPSSPDLFVSLDAASPGRLGELSPLLDAARTSVVVDHHASNPGFGDVRLVDPAAPATVVLVPDLLDGVGVTVDPPLATSLYAGLSADTGSLRFGSTQPGTHELAARLLATGIDHAAISQRLFDTAPFGWLGLLSVVTGRAVLEPDVGRGLVWTWSSTAEAAEPGLPGAELEALGRRAPP